MELKKAYLPLGEIREFKEGSSIFEILGCKKDITEPFIAIVDGQEVEDLSKNIYYDASIKPLGLIHKYGEKTYLRTLVFVFVKAVKSLYKGVNIVLKNSFSRGLYGEIENLEITEENINNIKKQMQAIIDSDIEIEKIKFKKSEVEKLFIEYDMADKLRSLKYLDLPYLSLYKCGDFYDYFYGNMLISTGYLKEYDILKNGNGFIIMSPTKDSNYKLHEFRDSPKLVSIFNQSQRVSDILDVSDIGSLNDKVNSEEINDVILVSESLHEKEIGKIADEIYENKDRIKIVAVAGPTAAGKSTFSKRLSIQLRILGFHPYYITLNDYLIDRKYIPVDDKGQVQVDTIEELDLKLFNEHLETLLNGGEINIPSYDYINGCRAYNERRFKIDEKTILIVEGMHCLNETVTKAIPRVNKFKIYVSALTQLNIDNHNTVEPKDVRVLRKIIRDYYKRGTSAEETISLWPHIDEVENKSIFPYQEEADAMFNSTVFYEMSILKKYVQPLLESIPKQSSCYVEAKRLLDIALCFIEADEKNIPQNSIIKEFIGKSCFDD